LAEIMAAISVVANKDCLGVSRRIKRVAGTYGDLPRGGTFSGGLVVHTRAAANVCPDADVVRDLLHRLRAIHTGDEHPCSKLLSMLKGAKIRAREIATVEQILHLRGSSVPSIYALRPLGSAGMDPNRPMRIIAPCYV
jgi:hypothetical protein